MRIPSGHLLPEWRRVEIDATLSRRTKCPLDLCLGKLSYDDILFFLYHLTTFSLEFLFTKSQLSV